MVLTTMGLLKACYEKNNEKANNPNTIHVDFTFSTERTIREIDYSFVSTINSSKI